jgi:hypothetical protein
VLVRQAVGTYYRYVQLSSHSMCRSCLSIFGVLAYACGTDCCLQECGCTGVPWVPTWGCCVHLEPKMAQPPKQRSHDVQCAADLVHTWVLLRCA